MHVIGTILALALGAAFVFVAGAAFERSNMERRGGRPQIDRALAVALAGQVQIGLARNLEPDELAGYGIASRPWVAELEESIIRARTALSTIGLMVRNTAHDADVDATLALDVQVQRDANGSRLIMRPPTHTN